MPDGSDLPTQSQQQQKPETTKLYAERKTSMPQGAREHIDAEEGDTISWKRETDDKGKKYLRVEKVALCILASMVVFVGSIYGTPAFAQQTVVTSPPPTVGDNQGISSAQQQEGPRVFQQTLFTLGSESKAAELPFRIEVTYPTGQGLIQNVTNFSPSTIHSITSVVGFPSPGLTTTTFSTSSIDTFNILLGQQYARPIDQTAIATLYSNNTVVNRYVIPISGSSFQVLFKISTILAPNLSPEALQQPVTSRLDRLEQKVDTLNAGSQSFIDSALNATNAVRGAILPEAALVAVNVVIMLSVLNIVKRYRNKQSPFAKKQTATPGAGSGSPQAGAQSTGARP
jgi:hypothetical protein